MTRRFTVAFGNSCQLITTLMTDQDSSTIKYDVRSVVNNDSVKASSDNINLGLVRPGDREYFNIQLTLLN